MNEERVFPAFLVTHLTNRLQNGSDSMSPTVPPNLDDHHIRFAIGHD